MLPVFRVVLPHTEASGQRLFRRSVLCAYSVPQIRVVDKIQSIGQTYFYMSTSPKTQYSYNVVKKLVKQAPGASFVFFVRHKIASQTL